MKENIKRKKKILELRVKGYQLKEIGEALGISKQRVHQIIRQFQKDQHDLRRLKRKKIL
ncbi:MAG: helix-turn-helix domain-containing protein [Candidatus Nealsonbacteria bacterium]